MKKRTIVTALAVVFGLALAGAIPALAQNEQPPGPGAACPFHDQEAMSYEDMEEWMGSGAHDEWMNSVNHERMHAAIGDMDRMMEGYGAMSGYMMGGMMSNRNMMGPSR
ncbi:MAG TPA: hypothetical protein VIG24_06845 [Acidimicrobiia bacterium]